ASAWSSRHRTAKRHALSGRSPPGDGTMIFAACLILAVTLLAYVFAPPAEITSGPEKDRVAFLRERKDMVYENLRDLNFEHKAGKLSDADFESLRGSLESEAAALLSEINSLVASSQY